MLCLSAPATAEPEQPSSVLLSAPKKLDLYTQPYSKLSESQRWKADIHGLRSAPLHPQWWEVRQVDRTENHRLVPMRPFFLRASEDPGFELTSLEVVVRFPEAGAKQMQQYPEQKTAMLDVEFGGVFLKGAPGDRDRRDAAYVVRLTTSPLFESGIFYRSHQRYLALALLPPGALAAGADRRVLLRTQPTATTLLLDGTEVARMPGDHRRGLLSLCTDWHPLSLSELTVTGTLRQGSAQIPFVASGLVEMRAK